MGPNELKAILLFIISGMYMAMSCLYGDRGGKGTPRCEQTSLKLLVLGQILNKPEMT